MTAKSKSRGRGHDPVAARLIAKAESLGARQMEVTVPVIQADEDERPEVVGSAVLFAIAGVRFLVTAGHVLDRIQLGPLGVGMSPELLGVAGLPSRLRTPGTAATPKKDKIDIGIMRVAGKPWEEIGLERFLTLDELDIGGPAIARNTYGLVGYPNSVNRKAVVGDRIKTAAYRMAGLECDADAYRETKTDSSTSIMLGFDKQEMVNADGPYTAPDLYGASGCGLWRYGRRINDAVGPPKLSAIAVEWHEKGRHRHVLGTRIELVVQSLVDKYDDVREHIEQLANQT
jgi:hypothetical protein